MGRKLVILVALFVSLCGADISAAPQEKAPSAEVKQEAVSPPSPVVLDNRTLFYVRERALSFAPEDRARAIMRKLDKLAGDSLVRPEAVSVVDSETTTDIVVDDLIIMSVTDSDARAEGRSRQELAGEYSRRISEALEKHREEYSPRSLISGIIYSAITTVVLIALLILFKVLFPKVYTKIEFWRGTRIRSIRIQSLEIIRADQIAALLKGIARGVRIFLVLLLLYFYIPLMFSFFPWTRGFAAKLLDYMLTPFQVIGRAIYEYLPNIFFLAVIILVTYYAIKLTRFFFAEVEKGTVSIPGFFSEWAIPTFKIVRFLLVAFAAIVAFPYLPGSESPAFRGVSIFLGVLFSLGSTSAVANVVAGVFLTYTRAFRIGDRVQIAETIGDITEKTLLVTRVRTIKNVDITIPNSMVLSSHVTNFSSSAREYGLILHTSVTIGYDAPWRTVHDLLIAAALATEHIMELPSPFVLQTNLNDFFVTYELNAFTDKPQRMATIYSDLHQNIQDKFNEAGVEIMSPHYSQIRDGNRTTIPDEYLPVDYEPPALRISQVRSRTEKTGADSERER
ncbi:MAG TPA: mechanosensitive ion channel domain-containing protein [Geobacteraceae bacterium]|nr:mechanosensitive ion channel domain-containing protein [Geobacteraceae bacterium]